MKTVVVGMSGGVDSSVTAYLLKNQGYKVIGLFMKNWEEEGDDCPAAADFQDVVSVCSQLDIPYYSVNFSKEYWDKVFAHCLKEFQAGHTPNPDILCNREIKFKIFFEKALSLGADFIATGHYCRKIGESTLARGLDRDKDQSYFLYTMRKEVLKQVLFPVGELTKKEVRAIASQMHLTTAEKKDSTGICFIGKRDFTEFLGRYISKKPGNFETLSNKVVGEHLGYAYYTIGQRRGLGIGGQGEAWYVVGKDVARNVVYVEQGDDHPALYSDTLTAIEESWVEGRRPLPLQCTAKIRYRSPDVPCTVSTGQSGELRVLFQAPQKAVTPRQSIVFYDGEVCLGGALIDQVGN
jgi:tRNA-specific 2-thiouridylase